MKLSPYSNAAPNNHVAPTDFSSMVKTVAYNMEWNEYVTSLELANTSDTYKDRQIQKNILYYEIEQAIKTPDSITPEDQIAPVTVVKVTVKWVEASRPDKQDELGNWYEEDSIFTSLEDASKAIRARAWHAPKQGDGYNKIDFIVDFSNEDGYVGRCDLQYSDRMDYSIKKQMMRHLEWALENPEYAKAYGYDLDETKATLALYKTF